MLRPFLLFASLAFASSAPAHVEKIPTPCGDKICLWERPVIDAPPGWTRDVETGQRLLVSMYRPNATSFAQAPGVFYAKAIALEGRPISRFVSEDLDRALARQLSLTAREVHPLRTRDGHELQAHRLAPKDGAAGGVETIAYGEEGEYALVFVLSARGAREHDALLPLFNAWVATYRRSPAAVVSDD